MFVIHHSHIMLLEHPDYYHGIWEEQDKVLMNKLKIFIYMPHLKI